DYTAPPAFSTTAPAGQPAGYANPAFLPIADPQCAWETTVAVVQDYFRIEHEEPARVVNGTPVTGTIRTAAEVSPTVFEPWRHDTADADQRVENTLQTIRRQAIIRVTPAQGGQWVDVAVYKELLDAVKPEHAMAGAATFRYDSSLVGVVNPIAGQQVTKGWIDQGRDTLLEQYIITHLLSRGGQPAPNTMRAQDR
ncbi:MAG: hypothetical protein ABFC96_15845, partial [Thermoguttaceae bacterium]